MEHRPILMGMNNPRGSDPHYALYPLPAGCAGNRLYSVLAERTQVSMQDYVATFDRRNLVAGPWDAREAAREAERLIACAPGRTIVLLGDAVRRAVGLPKVPLLPVEEHGVIWRQLPHPSGRCLWYNHPTHRLLAALMLEELYEMGRAAICQTRS